jgi:hypothetical protein
MEGGIYDRVRRSYQLPVARTNKEWIDKRMQVWSAEQHRYYMAVYDCEGKAIVMHRRMG